MGCIYGRDARNRIFKRDQASPALDLMDFEGFRGDEPPCAGPLELSCAEAAQEYGYRDRLNGSPCNLKNWCFVAVSLALHCTVLLGIHFLPQSHDAKTPAFLTITFIGDVTSSGGGVPGDDNAILNGEAAGEPGLAGLVPREDVPSPRKETPGITAEPKHPASDIRRKPKHDKPKRPVAHTAPAGDSSRVTIDPVGDGVAGQEQVIKESSGEGQGGNMLPGADGSGKGAGGTPGNGPISLRFGSPDGPRFIKRALPTYPETARKLDKEGHVILQLTIDEKGSLIEVELIKRAGFGFDEEAIKALRQSSFCPAKRDGRPVMCKAILPIKFVLKSGNDF